MERNYRQYLDVIEWGVCMHIREYFKNNILYKKNVPFTSFLVKNFSLIYSQAIIESTAVGIFLCTHVKAHFS